MEGVFSIDTVCNKTLLVFWFRLREYLKSDLMSVDKVMDEFVKADFIGSKSVKRQNYTDQYALNITGHV